MALTKEGTVLKTIGLMSGTSLDGVDAALLDTDGEAIVRAGPALTQPYRPEIRALLARAIADAAELPVGTSSPAVREAETMLTDAHVEAVRRLLDAAGLTPADIALIGFHGQTILHRPDIRRTWQIGDASRLADETNIAVIHDFRSADVAAGGQGAPLVPLYHAALVRAGAMALPVAVVNIGGVANVTYIGDTLLAFDTGPGNAPIDDWMERHCGQPIDQGGALARSGRVHEDVLATMLEHAHFAKRPPKSLDRLDFGYAAVADLSPADGAATLTAFTARSIARAAAHFPQKPSRWIVCGGGRHNPALMDALGAALGMRAETAEDVGWRGDFIEAEAFAYLAVRSARGLPLTLPSTTGVPRPMTGGRRYGAD